MSSRPRIASLDIIRGAAMVLMALDHVRSFASNGVPDPTYLAVTTPGLFATRWVTHLVAPAFVLLAGVGAYLYAKRPGRTRRDLSRFLWTRGLWLVFVEFTLVHFGWFFDLDLRFQFAQVIWAIGIAMLALSVLVRWSPRVVLGVGVAIVFLHNLLDPINPGPYFVAARDIGFGHLLWMILHDGGLIYWGGDEAAGGYINFSYPVLPWIGVIAIGYGMGPLWSLAPERRRTILLWLAAGAALLFVVLRSLNLYGDPFDWTSHPRGGLFTVMSFFNVMKYPPSLLFLAITLAPTFLGLALLETTSNLVSRRLAMIGSVPFFFYILHLVVIHIVASTLSVLQGHGLGWTIGEAMWRPGGIPEGFGLDLWLVYVVTLAVVMVHLPLCRWFARVKRDNPDKRWLSYF